MPFEFRSNLYGVLNPFIKKFPFGKLSSIFVSETCLYCFPVASQTYFLLFIFKCGNGILSEFLVLNDFRDLL